MFFYLQSAFTQSCRTDH